MTVPAAKKDKKGVTYDQYAALKDVDFAPKGCLSSAPHTVPAVWWRSRNSCRPQHADTGDLFHTI